MNNHFKIGVSVMLLIALFSCMKNTKIQKDSRAISYINGGPWHLVSSTNVSATGIISRYKGLLTDSINFAWTQGSNSNVICTKIYTFINGSTSTCNYDMKVLNTFGLCVLCSPAWKTGYSDTLFVNGNNTTAQSMVFQVKYADPNGVGIETDSLYR